MIPRPADAEFVAQTVGSTARPAQRRQLVWQL
jgi:hypothetical protein